MVQAGETSLTGYLLIIFFFFSCNDRKGELVLAKAEYDNTIGEINSIDSFYYLEKLTQN